MNKEDLSINVLHLTEGRKSVDEYIKHLEFMKELKTEQGKLEFINKIKLVLKPYLEDFNERGVPVSFMEVIDNIYIPEFTQIEKGGVTYFTYEDIACSVDVFGKIGIYVY